MTPKQEHIANTSDELLKLEPDISVEQLIARVCDQCNAEYSEVVEVLATIVHRSDPNNKDYLREAAKAVHAKLPDNHGFILLVTTPGPPGSSRLNYMSTFDRSDAINLLKEWLIKASGEEEWMKHLE